jgi:hypothetical protein
MAKEPKKKKKKANLTSKAVKAISPDGVVTGENLGAKTDDEAEARMRLIMSLDDLDNKSAIDSKINSLFPGASAMDLGGGDQAPPMRPGATIQALPPPPGSGAVGGGGTRTTTTITPVSDTKTTTTDTFEIPPELLNLLAGSSPDQLSDGQIIVNNPAALMGLTEKAKDPDQPLTSGEKIALATLAVLPLFGGLVAGEEGALLGVGAAGKGALDFGQAKLKSQRSRAASNQFAREQAQLNRMALGQRFQRSERLGRQKFQAGLGALKAKRVKVKEEEKAALRKEEREEDLRLRKKAADDAKAHREKMQKNSQAFSEKMEGKKEKRAVMARMIALQKQWRNSRPHAQFESVAKDARLLASLLRKAKSGVSDTLALIKLNKIFDPTSVARQSEVDVLDTAQSKVARFQDIWDRTLNNKRLTPEGAQEIAGVAKDLVEIHADAFERRIREIRADAVDQKVTPDTVATLEDVEQYRRSFDAIFEALEEKLEKEAGGGVQQPTGGTETKTDAQGRREVTVGGETYIEESPGSNTFKPKKK